MFENHIPGLAISETDIVRNSPLALTKILLAAATQKSDELAEFQAELESQRNNISWLRLETRAALNRATNIAKKHNPDIVELKTAEDTALKGIAAVNKAILLATVLILKGDPLIHAATTLVEEASAEMKKCTANTEAEIEDRHITADLLAKTSADILGLMQSVKSMKTEVSQIDEENQRDSVAEEQLQEARRVLKLR